MKKIILSALVVAISGVLTASATQIPKSEKKGAKKELKEKKKEVRKEKRAEKKAEPGQN